MSLSEITDPTAVLRAIAEYDSLTRDEFLHRYRFGRSRSYFLIHKGRQYDSKAILGAAYGFQYPDREPLGSHDFNGGEAGTARKLRELGFDVPARRESGARVADTRRYWALVANPAIYDIDAAVAAGAVQSWSSHGKPLRPGDGIVLWRSRGRNGRRGIVAIGEVTGKAYRSSDEHDPFWIDKEAAALEEYRVPIRLFAAPTMPLWMGGEHRTLLEGLPVARARGGTVFSVDADQWAVVVGLAGVGEKDPDDGPDDTGRFAVRGRSRTGQGWGLSAVERRAVELHAMELAKAHYSGAWDTVQDVSGAKSYDLECRSGEQVLRVEVKGTTGTGDTVLLTRNEVEHARAMAPRVALFVVSGIELQRDMPDPRARGGVVTILEPWNIDSCNLAPVTFVCTLPLG